jgi:hypothetical protein
MLSDQLIERLVADAATIALYFVGVPREEALLGLAAVRDDAKKALLEFMPDEIATLVSEAFITGVAGHAAELEAAGQKGSLQ